MDAVQERATIYLLARIEEVRGALELLPDGPELEQVEEMLGEMERIVGTYFPDIILKSN